MQAILFNTYNTVGQCLRNLMVWVRKPEVSNYRHCRCGHMCLCVHLCTSALIVLPLWLEVCLNSQQTLFVAFVFICQRM